MTKQPALLWSAAVPAAPEGYEHAWLTPERVFCPWFCLDRRDGRLLWESDGHGADSIHAIDRGVIVASRFATGGPASWHEGIVAVALEDGRLLWTDQEATRAARRGLLQRLLACLVVRVEAVSFVHDGQVHTQSGLRLDVRTGAPRGRWDPADPRWRPLRALTPKTPAEQLYRDGEAALAGGGALILGTPEQALERRRQRRRRDADVFVLAPPLGGEGAREICRLDDADRPQWRYVLPEDARVEGNYYGYRLGASRLYIVWERRGLELAAIDLAGGEACVLSLSETPPRAARIEDCDGEGLLVSTRDDAGTRLHYFA